MNEKMKLLTTIQADALVMFTKLHNYHWNIKGLGFYELHAKTEEFYNAFSTIFDDVAERILQLSGTPLVTMKQILEISTIKEDDRTDFDAKYILSNIKSDFEEFHKLFCELHKITDDDTPTQSYADEKKSFFEKELWMLRQTIG